MQLKINNMERPLIWLIIATFIISLFVMKSKEDLKEICDPPKCKFSVGDDVIIKNKTFNNNATVSKVFCDCSYEITYYSYVMRQRRRVNEFEIRKPLLGF